MLKQREKDKQKEEREEVIFKYFDKILNELETTKQWALINIWTMFILLLVYKLISVKKKYF